MSDRQFFPLALAMSLSDIADLTGANIVGPHRPEWGAGGLASLDRAGPSEVTFFSGIRFVSDLRRTRAGACFLREQDCALAPANVASLVVAEPARAFARLAATLYPGALGPVAVGIDGIAVGATIDPSARLEVGASIAAGVVLGRRVEIGTGTSIGPHSIIGDGVRIGRGCTIGPNVTITHSFLGDRVVVHAGARLGQEGFGFVPSSSGHTKVAQLGRVIVQDDVEIGANATVDRGALDDTVIGEGTKIDNLVHIAHNVVVGRGCLLAAQVGIAGSTEIGDFVAIGGQAGISGHLRIGAGARIAGKSGVLHDVPAGTRVGGSPAGPVSAWLREAVRLRRGPRIDGRV